MGTITIDYGNIRGQGDVRKMTGPFGAADTVVIEFTVPERNQGFTLGVAQVQSDAMMKLALDGNEKPGSITSLSRNVQDPDKAAGDHKAVLTVDADCHDVAVDLTVR